MNVEALQKEVAELKTKIKDLEAHLKKYTNPERCHKYYYNHKDEINVKKKDYRETVSKEKIQEYNRQYYQRKKEALGALS
jgi:uncharacterized protein YlxW (UPF0749 family)